MDRSIEYEQLSRAFRAFTAVNRTILNAENEQDLLTQVCNKIVEVSGYRFVWVGYVSNDEEQTVIPAASAGYEEGYLKTLHIKLKDAERGFGPTGLALRTNQAYICRNTRTDPRFLPWREEALKRNFRSSIAIPLTIKSEAANGVIMIYGDKEDLFDDKEVELLSEMARNLAFGINYLRAHFERNQKSAELEISLKKTQRVLMQTVNSLAATYELRDPYTAGHHKRTTELSKGIAMAMGLSTDEIEGIAVAATLHDIGKTVIPSEILSKPGKISDIEIMLLQTHSQAGYDIIKEIEFPWPVKEIILQHHEKMNGSGYPNGLKGNHILLGARILCVADVVEAMSSHRPYRPAIGIDAALDEIVRHRGTLYDEIVVDACVDLFKNKGYDWCNQSRG